jgi:hypothetical protein
MTDVLRDGPGRRAHDTADMEGFLAKTVVKWIVGVGLALAFAAGAWAMDTRSRIVNLEQGQFTREEAAGLRSSLDLLRAEISYLRSDMNRIEATERKR